MISYVKVKCSWCNVLQLTAKLFAASWLNLEQSSGDQALKLGPNLANLCHQITAQGAVIALGAMLQYLRQRCKFKLETLYNYAETYKNTMPQ